ncbi:MAG TPA: DNA double-strand break repair nuclease NurA [Firmicutes bacterium]|nr:DNA double-strand break repair nuclease NurA [Bacillota bacterium]
MRVLVFDEGIKVRLRELNDRLATRRAGRPGFDDFRRLLEANLGRFVSLAPISEDEIDSWAQGRPVVGVDGSVNSYGESYPYVLHIFQASARTTRPLDGKDHLTCSSVVSPLFPEDRRALEDERDRLMREDKPLELAWEGLRHRRLAELEVEVAIRAVNEIRPFLVIFDGGFMRYVVQAFDKWNEYRRVSLEQGVISVGVIEETATKLIAEVLGDKLPPGLRDEHDRSLLFGVLREGEALGIREDIRFKRSEFYTAFARFSRHPQAIACDFFREQVDHVKEVLDFLYTITPQGGRGMPLWLDIVDQEVRITGQDLEMMLSLYLDRDLMEMFLRPHRDRRDY